MEVDAPAQPSAQPPTQPPAQTHAPAPDGGEAQATAPLWEDPLGLGKAARTSKDKEEGKTVKWIE